LRLRSYISGVGDVDLERREESGREKDKATSVAARHTLSDSLRINRGLLASERVECHGKAGVIEMVGHWNPKRNASTFPMAP